MNNAEWGTDYLSRTATVSKGDMFENSPAETQSTSPRMTMVRASNSDGRKMYTVTFANGQTPPGKGNSRSLTLYNAEHFFNPNPLN